MQLQHSECLPATSVPLRQERAMIASLNLLLDRRQREVEPQMNPLKGRSSRRKALAIALLALATFVYPVRLAAEPPTSTTHVKTFDPAMMSELVGIVREHGWPANMGRMCATFNLGSESNCNFKQMAVSEGSPGTVEDHGFNLPEISTGPDSYVVIFHLTPLVGNFFVVSPEGTLKASFYRAKGVDYTEIPNEDARRAFAVAGAFWKQNLPKLKDLIAAGGTPGQP